MKKYVLLILLATVSFNSEASNSSSGLRPERYLLKYPGEGYIFINNQHHHRKAIYEFFLESTINSQEADKVSYRCSGRSNKENFLMPNIWTRCVVMSNDIAEFEIDSSNFRNGAIVQVKEID